MTDSGRVYRGKEIKTDMNLEYGIDISYPQAWCGKCYALELIRGSVEESFTKLPLYCHNLKKANPGTVTHIKTDDMERFEFFFVAIGASIRSFLNCLRPLLIIDGAHLKGKYLGTMFLAVGMDGNNQIVPIAFGVGKTESGESWSWFMTKLKECIGEQPGLAIISDRANSIDSALRQVFPHAYHGLCCRHLMVNIKLNTKQKQKYQDLYWKTCKSYTVSEFELWKARLEAVVPSVTQTLQQASYEKWARAHYPGNRYNIMTSNSAESINSLSRFSRKLPIVALVEWYREFLQDWYYRRRKFGENLDHMVTKFAQAKIEKRLAKSTAWETRGIDQYRYQVRDLLKTTEVNLATRTCSCRKWQLSGVPCGHVISVMRYLKRTDCIQWVQKWYTKHVYQETYEEPINPLPDQTEWESLNEPININPPLMDKRQAGRPRNKDRIPSRGEEKRPIECSRCGEMGHKRDRCSAQVPYQSSSRYKSRKASGYKSSKSSVNFSKPQDIPPNEASMENRYRTFDLNDALEMYTSIDLKDF